MFTIHNNHIEQAEFIASPNCSDRPKGEKISLLVIHNLSLPPCEFGSKHVIDFFLNRLDSSQHPFFEEISTLVLLASSIASLTALS